MSENQNQNPNESQLNDTTAPSTNVGEGIKNAAGSAANAVKNKLGKKVGGKVMKKLGIKAAGSAAKLSLAAPLATVLFWVFVAIVALILLIGIIMFIVTMPGMMMDKLKDLAEGIADAWLAWWGGDASKQVSEEKIYETLDYIEDMGFDLKGYGFLTGYKSDDDVDDLTSAQTEAGYSVDDTVGVIRNSENNIILAESDFVNSYLASENYIYTIKNFNQADVGAWVGFWDRLGALFADSMKNRTGMLVLKHEGGAGIGDVSDDMYDSFERGHIKADPSSKSLEIKKGWTNGKMKFSLDGWTGRYGMPLDFLVSVQTATFMPDLAYDMTQKFKTEVNILLHESKGELVGCYKTDAGRYIKYEDISLAINGVTGEGLSNIISEIDEWGLNKNEAQTLYDLGIIPPSHNPPDCGCVQGLRCDTAPWYAEILERDPTNGTENDTSDDVSRYYYREPATDDYGYFIYDENGNFVYEKDENGNDVEVAVSETEVYTSATKIGSRCKEYLKAVVNQTDANNKYSYETYTPYIEKVTDHWYRDVYFISNSSVKSFVDYDYDYESVMKERWTLYEKYTAEESAKGTYKYNPEKAGQEILLVIDEDGNYKKEDGDYVAFDGTIEDANPSILYQKVGEKYEKLEESFEDAKEAGITVYRKSSDGTYVIHEGDIAVSKKAVTINIADKFDDLNWHDLGGGVYSAYSPDETQLSDWQQPLKPGVAAYDDANDNERAAMSRIYVEVKIGVVNQTGEGQRTETNSKIKKMFLQNNYFRYDGSAETAEIITELRNKIYEDRKSNDSDAAKYGPLTDEELEKEYTITYGADEDQKTEIHKVRDYAGKLEVLTQDALNAFSMLENTHTLDADYIYRDFKELIVELGYFEKEVLTDETPRLLQFPVPSIGSAEYPARSIDKRTNELGTMIHSKYDIDTNEEYITLDIEASEIGDLDEEGTTSTEEPIANAGASATTISESQITRVAEGRVSLSSNSINMSEVGAIDGATKKAQQVTVDEFLKSTREMCEYINEVGYDYCVMCIPGESKNGDTCTCPQTCIDQFESSGKCLRVLNDPACTCKANHCKHSIHENDCHLALDFESSKADGKNNFCCDRLVKWALQNVGLISKSGGAGGADNLGNYIRDELGAKEIAKGEPLKEGDILCSSGHIEIVGEKKDGAFVQYNGGHEVPVGAVEGQSGSSIGLKTEADSWSWAERVLRLPWSQAEDAIYEGFEGNEAVVSPVTGVLIDYGTYNREDDEKRENVDLKYGPSVKIHLDEEGNVESVEGNTSENTSNNAETTNTDPTTQTTTEEFYEPTYDEVGYAVIRVMSKEDFEYLESNIESYWSSFNDEQGLLDNSGVFHDELTTEESLKELLDSTTTNGFLAETIYGYKEFAELYSTYGVYINSTPDDDEDEDNNVETVKKLISGYTIFIDGFKCELPDENFVDTNEDGSIADEEGKPSGKALTIDTFRISPDNIKDTDQLTQAQKDENEMIQTQYETPDEYKLASKSATERLNIEEVIKSDAYYAMEVGDLIYIKEGTVIGRTYTDREVVEDLRDGEKLEDYKISMTKTEEELESEDYVFEDKLIGNYLRVIMQETGNTTVVEDVENYMKLDEVTQSGDQEYQFREGDLEILADAIHHEGCGAYCAVLLGTSGKEDELYLAKSVGFTIINKLNTDSGFTPDYNDPSELWDSTQSPLYNLLCRIPSAERYQVQADEYGFTTGREGGWYAIAPGLRHRIEIDELDYCDTCFEAAEYIKENDSMNHKNNGEFGTDFALGEGMPHTCWQQGAGYNGTSKIWVYCDSNKNGVKDTECTDDGDFYLFDTAD